jgi:hypothetical protein
LWGIEPTSKFEDKSKEAKMEEFVSASGMIPDKLLLFKKRYCSCWRRPRRGKRPIKLLLERSSSLRKVRLPREELIWPAKLEPLRRRYWTRHGRIVVHVTPFQSSWSNCSRLHVDH